MCIGGTLYVCSHIILLSTPTIAGVTKIAHRERVPNGALPKLGRVLTPLWGRTTPSSKKRRPRWGCAPLFHQLLCHHENMLLPWVVLVWQMLYRKELLAKQDIIAHWYYGTRLLISSFAGCKSFLCAWTHILFSSSRAWSHLRCTPMELLPASQYGFLSMVFVLEHIWNNGRQQQHLIVAVTLRDWLCLSRYRYSLVDVILHQGWMPHLCSWNLSVYMNTYSYQLHLCSWSHTVWIRWLSKMSWRHSMCLAAYHNCSWSYIRAAATWCDWTHKLEKCFKLETLLLH